MCFHLKLQAKKQLRVIRVFPRMSNHKCFMNEIQPCQTHLLIQMYLKSYVLLQVLQLSVSWSNSAAKTASIKSWFVRPKVLRSQLFPGASTAPRYAHSHFCISNRDCKTFLLSIIVAISQGQRVSVDSFTLIPEVFFSSMCTQHTDNCAHSSKLEETREGNVLYW